MTSIDENNDVSIAAEYARIISIAGQDTITVGNTAIVDANDDPIVIDYVAGSDWPNFADIDPSSGPLSTAYTFAAAVVTTA